MAENSTSSEHRTTVNPKILLQINNIIAEAEPKRASDPNSALALTEQALVLARPHSPAFSNEMAAILLMRCKILTEFSNYNDALIAGTEALQIAESEKNNRLIKSILLTIANIYSYQGIYDEAINFMHRAINLHDHNSTQNDELISLGRSLNNLGYTYVVLGDVKKGLPYLKKSLGILRKIGNKEFLSPALDSLSIAYLNIGYLPKALTFAIESYQLAKEIDHLSAEATAALQIARIHLQQNDLITAEPFLKKALKLSNAHQFLSIKAEVFHQFAELEKLKGEPEACIAYLQKALVIAKKIDRKHRIADLLGDIAHAYKDQENFAEAFKYIELHHEARDIYSNQRSAWRLKNLEIAFDVAQVRRENELVRQKNNALQNEIRSKQLVDYSEKLGDEVKLRTAELEHSNQQLQSALQNLAHNQQELAHAERMAAMGTLVVGITHELSTPIGNCVLVATTLADNTNQFVNLMSTHSMRRSDLSNYVDNSEQSIRLLMTNLNAAVRLVNNFKQIANTRENEDRRSFYLHQLIKEITQSQNDLSSENRADVTWQIPDDLTLVSYPRSLVQVIAILIDNAQHHAFGSRADGTITVSARLDGDHVHIQLSDNGVGMSAELLTHIFDPFFTTQLGKGSHGLGLSIVFNLVTNILDGDIKVTSRVGAGTEFTIVIPRVAN